MSQGFKPLTGEWVSAKSLILYLPIAAKVRHIINNPTQNKK